MSAVKPSIMIGVTTYNRPEYLAKSLRAIGNRVKGVPVYVHNDGSDAKHNGEYKRAYSRMPDAIILDSEVNRGVSASKNSLLMGMLGAGADWLFLCEDDILVQSPAAIFSYIEACEKSNFQHLSFAHHGPANAGGPVWADDVLAYYPHSIGAWCIYSAECLNKCGLFDENLLNAWEHVELSLRLAQAGYTSGAYNYADVIGSDKWLSEIPGSVEKSSIRPRADWHKNIRNGLIYWRDNKPDTYEQLFGPGLMLEGWAKGIVG